MSQHGAGALSPWVAEALSSGRAPPTWNWYTGPARTWAAFAEIRGMPWLPADPILFAEFLVQRAALRGGPAIKAACCAISAFSEVAGVPYPGEHPLVAAVRRGARRTGGTRRGGARPIFSEEIPPPPAQGTPAAQAAPRPLTERARRARAAASDHMSVLLAGAFRYDDLAEGQLGNILHFPECVETDPASAGQAAFIPRGASPTSGASRLVQMTARGLRLLLAADPALLANASSRPSVRWIGRGPKLWQPGLPPSQNWRALCTPPGCRRMCSPSSGDGSSTSYPRTWTCSRSPPRTSSVA